LSKILPASCVGSIVTVEGKPVQAAILSQGIKSSDGVALFEENEISYVTSNATDIKDLITKVTDLIQLASDTFTAIGTGMTGPTTAPPGTLPTSITQLATLKTALTLMKENLK
jgi:hypothetical protein